MYKIKQKHAINLKIELKTLFLTCTIKNNDRHRLLQKQLASFNR